MTRAQKMEFCDEIGGLAEEEAKSQIRDRGLVVRVERRDGEFLPGTMDYRDDRINLFIENGTVTHAEIG
jgi:hypothetical protein